MTWFYLSLISVFALATAELTQQYLLNLKNGFNERTSTILTYLFQVPIVFLTIFIIGLSANFFSIFSPAILPKFLLVTFLSSISALFYFKSFKVKNISISVIFISFSVLISTSLGIVFFSESVNYLKFIGIALILLAIILVNYKNSILEKNHWYGLLAGLIFGLNYTLDKSIVLDIHPLIYMFWLFLLIPVWSFIFGAKSVVMSVKDKKFNAYKPIIISGISYLIFNFLTFFAYRLRGEVGRIDAINNSEIFLIILFEFFILKHIKGTVRKIFSACLAIAGIIILGLVK